MQHSQLAIILLFSLTASVVVGDTDDNEVDQTEPGNKRDDTELAKRNFNEIVDGMCNSTTNLNSTKIHLFMSQESLKKMLWEVYQNCSAENYQFGDSNPLKAEGNFSTIEEKVTALMRTIRSVVSDPLNETEGDSTPPKRSPRHAGHEPHDNETMEPLVNATTENNSMSSDRSPRNAGQMEPLVNATTGNETMEPIANATTENTSMSSDRSPRNAGQMEPLVNATTGNETMEPIVNATTENTSMSSDRLPRNARQMEPLVNATTGNATMEPLVNATTENSSMSLDRSPRNAGQMESLVNATTGNEAVEPLVNQTTSNEITGNTSMPVDRSPRNVGPVEPFVNETMDPLANETFGNTSMPLDRLRRNAGIVEPLLNETTDNETMGPLIFANTGNTSMPLEPLTNETTGNTSMPQDRSSRQAGFFGKDLGSNIVDKILCPLECGIATTRCAVECATSAVAVSAMDSGNSTSAQGDQPKNTGCTECLGDQAGKCLKCI